MSQQCTLAGFAALLGAVLTSPLLGEDLYPGDRIATFQFQSVEWDQEVLVQVPEIDPGLALFHVRVDGNGLRAEIRTQFWPANDHNLFLDRVGSVFEIKNGKSGWYFPYRQIWRKYPYRPESIEPPPYPRGSGALPNLGALLARNETFSSGIQWVNDPGPKKNRIRRTWAPPHPLWVRGLEVARVQQTLSFKPRFPVSEMAWDDSGNTIWSTSFSNVKQVSENLWVPLKTDTRYAKATIPGYMKIHRGKRTRVFLTPEGTVKKETDPERDVEINQMLPVPERTVTVDYFWHKKGIRLPLSQREYVSGKLVLAVQFDHFRLRP